MSRPSDRCPGVFSAHPAADGHLARIRLPGGLITPAQVLALVGVSDGFGDGHFELTSRGNVQVRGITDIDGAGELILDAGLIPSPSHERVRNLQLSALTGRRGGLLDARPVLAEFDRRLQSDAALAKLPARILFGVDDGRGDILTQGPDIGVLAIDDQSFDVVVGGKPTGRQVTAADAPAVMIDLAHAFLADRNDEWRVPDLAGRAAIDGVLAGLPVTDEYSRSQPGAEPRVGWLAQDDENLVALGSVVPHGRIPARVGEFLAAIERDIYLTPRKEILIVDLSEGMADTVLRVMAPMGLIFDENSPWTRITDCTGSPGCDKSHTDVRGDLDRHLGAVDVAIDDREHWVGCERGCGSPHEDHIRVEATPTGYTRRRL
ncbi:precorrin-3B synthase [Nocardia sp. 348MFTsu5.1]|uniref:precorrin-3B synthase n=1 Tax=Nocardia sp. 348MFTsu5.1 TaxID=1172185 RepID=UPI00048B2133|nr:precorrin-3B synthase [Nocardia sp. 348MFTsu5.1]